MLKIKSLLLFFAVLLQGCGTFGVTYHSAPRSDGPYSSLLRSAHIIVDRVQFYIKPNNDYLLAGGVSLLNAADVPLPWGSNEFVTDDDMKYGPSNPYLLVEILVFPQKQHVSLNFESIRLLYQNQLLSPRGFWRTEARSGGQFGGLCHSRGATNPSLQGRFYFLAIKPEDPKTTVVDVDGDTPVCFIIQYPIAPIDPRNAFSMEFSNIIINGKSANLPILNFIPIEGRGGGSHVGP